MSVEATVVIDFGEAVDTSSYLAVIELDEESNDEKTSFTMSDQPVIAAHFSNNVRIDAVVSTDGNVQSIGSVTRSKESTNVFASRILGEESTYRLPVVPTTYSTAYAGRQGAITAEKIVGGIVELSGDVTKTPFLAKYVCNYVTNLYQLIPPDIELVDDETYEIVIVFYLTLKDA